MAVPAQSRALMGAFLLDLSKADEDTAGLGPIMHLEGKSFSNLVPLTYFCFILFIFGGEERSYSRPVLLGSVPSCISQVSISL
jgi:hypothetical protein